jgi:hypothetical protein
MDESTQDETTAGTPTGYGYCSWHRRFAAGVRLIDVTEQNTGPGRGHYACEPCRKTYRLVPLADR